MEWETGEYLDWFISSLFHNGFQWIKIQFLLKQGKISYPPHQSTTTFVLSQWAQVFPSLSQLLARLTASLIAVVPNALGYLQNDLGLILVAGWYQNHPSEATPQDWGLTFWGGLKRTVTSGCIPKQSNNITYNYILGPCSKVSSTNSHQIPDWITKTTWKFLTLWVFDGFCWQETCVSRRPKRTTQVPHSSPKTLRHGGGDASHPNSTPDALCTLGPPKKTMKNEGFNP